jgi:hypothetical protein
LLLWYTLYINICNFFIMIYIVHKYHRCMGHGFRFLLPSFLYYPLPFFLNFHINHSFFKIYIIIRFSSFDNISRRHTSWIIRVFCVRLLILSNEEKRMIMKIVKKEWFIWKFSPVLSITVIYQYSFFNTPTVFVSRISLCRSRRYWLLYFKAIE